MGTHDQGDLRRQVGRVEELIRRSEALPDPATRELIRELVRTLMDFHGAGLARILDHLAAAGEPCRAVTDALARDEVVGSLLLLYGLHPRGIEERVREALGRVRPRLRARGGDVELLGVENGVVQVRADGNCDGPAIEELVYEAAPDATSVEVTRGAGENGRANARFALPLVRG